MCVSVGLLLTSTLTCAEPTLARWFKEEREQRKGPSQVRVDENPRQHYLARCVSILRVIDRQRETRSTRISRYTNTSTRLVIQLYIQYFIQLAHAPLIMHNMIEDTIYL